MGQDDSISLTSKNGWFLGSHAHPHTHTCFLNKKSAIYRHKRKEVVFNRNVRPEAPMRRDVTQIQNKHKYSSIADALWLNMFL